MKKLLVVVPALLSVLAGCWEQPREDVLTPVAATIPDGTLEEEGLTTRFYDSGNRHTEVLLAELGKQRELWAEMNRFDEMGYVHDPTHSFVLDGEAADGRQAEIAVLGLRNTRDDDRDAIHLYCIRREGGFAIVPLRIEFEDSGPASGRDGDIRFTPVDPIDTPDGPSIEWSWKRWGKCVTGQLMPAVVLCYYNCRFVPVGAPKCFVVCTGIRAAVALIGCSIAEL